MSRLASKLNLRAVMSEHKAIGSTAVADMTSDEIAERIQRLLFVDLATFLGDKTQRQFVIDCYKRLVSETCGTGAPASSTSKGETKADRQETKGESKTAAIGVIQSQVVPDPQHQKRLAFLYALTNLGTAVIKGIDDCADLGLKLLVLTLNVLIDHSASMWQLDGSTIPFISKSVCDVLQEVVAECCVDIRIAQFGDYRQLAHGILSSVDLYRKRVIDGSYDFDGSLTEIAPVWDRLADNPSPNITTIISDGAFNSKDPLALQKLVYHPGVQAVVFYATTWADEGVTQQHAQVLRNAIPAGAVYNGDVPPREIRKLKEVLLSLIGRGGGSVPQLPGHTKIGTLSIPSLFLQPSGFSRLLALCMSEVIPVEQSAVFITRLCDIYNQLAASVRQDTERCLRSSLFCEFMSLVSGTIKHLDAIFGEQGTELKSAFKPHGVRLLKVVKELQSAVSSQKQLLINRLKELKDAVKIAEIEALYRAAMTVSERPEILERQKAITKGPAKAQVLFPTCSDPVQLAAMFDRLLLPYAESKPEHDYMLTAIFEKAHLAPMTATAADVDSARNDESKGDSKLSSLAGPSLLIPSEEHRVHAFRTKTRNVDLITVIRLLPGFLLHEQTRHKTATVALDFTIQPAVAARILCMLKVAHLQGAKFPSWVVSALEEQARVTPDMIKESDAANLSVYWLKILWQLRDGLTKQEQDRVWLRLTAHAYKEFGAAHLGSNANLPYKRALFPGVKPLIDTDEPAAFMVFCVDEKKDRTTLINVATQQPYAGGTEIFGADEQHAAFQKNLDFEGGWVDGYRYITENRVFTCDTTMPSPEKALMAQLLHLNRKRVEDKQPAYSEIEILAHIDTLSRVYASKIGQGPGHIPLVQWLDAKSAQSVVKSVQHACRDVVPASEDATFFVSRTDLHGLFVQYLQTTKQLFVTGCREEFKAGTDMDEIKQKAKGDAKAAPAADASNEFKGDSKSSAPMMLLSLSNSTEAARALQAVGDYPRLQAQASFKFEEKFAGEIDYIMDCIVGQNPFAILPSTTDFKATSKIMDSVVLAKHLDALASTLRRFIGEFMQPPGLVSPDNKELADIKIELKPVAVVSDRRRTQLMEAASTAAATSSATASDAAGAVVGAGKTKTASTALEWPQCPILYDDIVTPEVTTCGHTFEAAAIKQWLETRTLCPVCNTVVKSTSVNYGMFALLDHLKSLRAASPSASSS